MPFTTTNVGDDRMSGELAIIIPAYRKRFLAESLDSILAQVSGDCRVYVLDDNSPHGIEDVVQKALARFKQPIFYERFETNLGGTDLAKHFDRCVRKTTEPWIWVFSDDDVMNCGCVAALQEAVRECGSQYDVFYFDTVEVNAEGSITALNPVLPVRESWKQYAYFLFRGQRVVPLQAMVFSRSAYDRAGGFVNFPLAWASDQATLMALAGEKGLKRVNGASIRFRKSGENISSVDSAAMASQKLRAAMLFMQWFMRHLDEAPDTAFPLSDDVLRLMAFQWFKQHLVDLHVYFTPRECFDAARFVNATWKEPFVKAFARMLSLDLCMMSGDARAGIFRRRRAQETRALMRQPECKSLGGKL